MKKIRPLQQVARSTLLLFLLIVPSMSYGQWNASASLDTNRIRIGEQPTLTLTLDHTEQKDDILFPSVKEQLGEDIELIEASPVDTLKPDPDQAPKVQRLVQRFKITSFDTGYHPIPPLAFKLGNDTARTEPLLLEVKSVKLGKDPKPKPIKDVHRFPYSWSAWFEDHWHWFAIAGGILALALLFFILYRRWTKKEPKEESAPPPRPPHEVAMERLEKLEKEKAWQEKDPKDYYTLLSNIIRQFLEDRYGFPALEETTARILHELSFTDIDEEGKGRARKILKRADMVKFAKERPIIPDRENDLSEAKSFVERTAPRSSEAENGEEG